MVVARSTVCPGFTTPASTMLSGGNHRRLFWSGSNRTPVVSWRMRSGICGQSARSVSTTHHCGSWPAAMSAVRQRRS